MKVRKVRFSSGGKFPATPSIINIEEREAELLTTVDDLKTIFKDRARKGFDSHNDWIRLKLGKLDHIIDTKYNRGFPIGTCVLLSGKSQTGKTLLIALLAYKFEKRGGYSILVDTEDGFNPDFAKDVFGLNIDNMVSIETNIIEEVFQGLLKIIERREFKLKEYCKKHKTKISEINKKILPPLAYFWDSYKGCILNKERNDKFIQSLSDEAISTGAKTDALLSQRRIQELNRQFPKIISRLRNTRITFVIVTHEYDVMQAFGGTRTAGGNAFKYYPSLHIKMTNLGKISVVKNKQKIVKGKKILFKIEKNRFGLPDTQVVLKLSFNKGFLAEDALDD